MPVPLGSVVVMEIGTDVVRTTVFWVPLKVTVGRGGVSVICLVLAAETLPAASLTNSDTLWTPLPTLSVKPVGMVSFQVGGERGRRGAVDDRVLGDRRAAQGVAAAP